MTFIFFLACPLGPNRNLICPRNIKLNWNGLKYPLTFSSLPLLVVWSLSAVTDRTRSSQRTFASLEYRMWKIDFTLSPGTTSYRQHFTKESYQGTRPQSHCNSELKLALSSLSDVKIKWRAIYCHSAHAYTCCEHARPLLAPPPVQS